MSIRKSGYGWLLAFVPLLLGVIVASLMLVAGETRALQTQIALPAVILIAGGILTTAAVLTLSIRSARSRRSVQLAAAISATAADVTERERQNHRRFLARLDHELKNPITAIRATVVGSGDDSPHWRTIDAQAQKLSTLVRDLRKLAEIETRPLEREPVSLQQLLGEAIEALAQQNPHAGARVSLTVTDVPWPVPEINADLDLLSLAIDNALSNAAKYSVDGPIEARLREEQGWAIIEIADKGRGIPAADLPLVFDELARAQNVRDVPGSGLGLTLVSTVLQRHGGTATVRSATGAGTVVTLRIPLNTQARG